MDFSFYFFSANDSYDFGARYEFILDVAKYADRHGFTAIWTPERHFQEFGGSFPNPAVLSSALAVATENLDIRAGSVVLPHHHPVRVVEDWSLVDQLSGGRVGLCIATGWHQGDFVFYPENYHCRREYSFKHIDTLRSLWRGEPAEFAGPDQATFQVRTFPRPRQAELPMWLVHTSNPQTWVTAGERGLNVLTLLDSWERLERNIASYREARERAGFDPSAGRVTVGMHTYIGSDEQEVWELVREPVQKYLGSFMAQKSTNGSSPGTAANGADESERANLTEVATDDYFRRRSLLGTVDKCVPIVERLSSIGATEIASLVDFGLPFETVRNALPYLDELRGRFQGSAGRTKNDWYYSR